MKKEDIEEIQKMTIYNNKLSNKMKNVTLLFPFHAQQKRVNYLALIATITNNYHEFNN